MIFEIDGRVFRPGDVALMGVVNVTPDSFSDGGHFLDPERAIAHGLQLVADGAHILDIGGESSRPGAQPVSEAEELRRVLPVIVGLRAGCDVPLSIDTVKPAVARAACEAGATLVNDIRGLRDDLALGRVAAESGASLCVMHMQGTPETMQSDPRYTDVVDEVVDALIRARARAESVGVAREKILVDPGIGFGKRLEHNLALVARCGEIAERAGAPVLMGVSRKSFIGQLTGQPVEAREFGTAAAVAACVASGARVVRVHDVRAMRDVVVVARSLAAARAGGEPSSGGPGRSVR